MKGFQKGDPRARVAGQAGGRVSGLKRKRTLLKQLAERWPIPVDLLHAIYAYGQRRYRSGIQATRRAA